MLRDSIAGDRQFLTKSKIAFVSYIRAYKEHKCNYLLIFKKLNLGKLATSFALLKLPRMPELRETIIEDFEPIEIDLDSIPYKDKKIEKQRKIKLQLKMFNIKIIILIL